MGTTKKFTILHSNDMHGDFLAEMRGEQGHLIGGLSLLRGTSTRSVPKSPTSSTASQATWCRGP